MADTKSEVLLDDAPEITDAHDPRQALTKSSPPAISIRQVNFPSSVDNDEPIFDSNQNQPDVAFPAANPFADFGSKPTNPDVSLTAALKARVRAHLCRPHRC